MKILILLSFVFLGQAFAQNTNRLETLIREYEVEEKNIIAEFPELSMKSDGTGKRVDVYLKLSAKLEKLRARLYPSIYQEALASLPEDKFLDLIQREKTKDGIVMGGISDLLAYHNVGNMDLLIERTFENGAASRRFLISQFSRGELENNILEKYAQSALFKFPNDVTALDRFFSVLNLMAADYSSEKLNKGIMRDPGSRFIWPALSGMSKELESNVGIRTAAIQYMKGLYSKVGTQQQSFIDTVLFAINDPLAQRWVEDAIMSQDYERSKRARSYLRPDRDNLSANFVLRLASSGAEGATYENYEFLSDLLQKVLKREDKRSIEAKQIIAWMLMQKSTVVVATAVHTLDSPAFSAEDFIDKISMYLGHPHGDVRLNAISAVLHRLKLNEDLTALEPILIQLKVDKDVDVANDAKMVLSEIHHLRSYKCRAFFQ